MGAAKEENKELLTKLTTEERERSVEARLKNTQTQAKDKRKLLYQTEIELVTSRQPVLELKEELQKAKKVA